MWPRGAPARRRRRRSPCHGLPAFRATLSARASDWRQDRAPRRQEVIKPRGVPAARTAGLHRRGEGAGSRRMQVWSAVDDVRMPLAKMTAHAQRAERLGFDGLIVPEAVYDAIPAATLALASTTRLRVATGVIVAFARSPMLVAQDAWALAQLSGGRFAIGLGPQVKGNVEG